MATLPKVLITVPIIKSAGVLHFGSELREPIKNKSLAADLNPKPKPKNHSGQQFTAFALRPPCPIRAGRQCGHFEGLC
jgi:hypothetical protein